ncbi:MAG: hypothetical protein KDD64_10410 [Bdellovibrionales bacterium]|nr:hypothetical protein [Bdellovibrionales bacterium]
MSFFVRFSFLGLLFLIASCHQAIPVPPPQSFPPQYTSLGRDLVHGLAACGFCHGSRPEPGVVLSGGIPLRDTYGSVIAPNITPSNSGIRGWNVQEIADAVRASLAPDGRSLASEHHQGYQWMSDDDVYRIVAYLQTQPPVETSYETREIGFIDRYTSGILEQRKEVDGVVPSLEGTAAPIYGQYLVEHVARCDQCHSTPGDFIAEEKYLQGGREISRAGEIRVAPNITGSKVYGLGSWSIPEIVRYLQTGQVPGNRRTDPRFCPTQFYARAKESDLSAIAVYLLSTETSPS